MKLIRILPGIVLAFIISLGIAHGLAFAQTTTSIGACITVSSDLRYGAQDMTNVRALQQFLSNQGYFDSAYIGSGPFGPMTLKGVLRFQATNSLPVTGFVGPLTRAAMIRSQNGCGTSSPISTTSAPILDTINPSSGAVGATVSLTGSGFTGSTTILFGGSVAAINGTSTSHTLTFTVPSSLAPHCNPGVACPMYMRLVTPGQYNVTVQDDNGTSNAIVFTVTSAPNYPI